MSRTGTRVAMVSVHTSPLDQPGTGDAGGMNVYVTELAHALADQGANVEIFTRATDPHRPTVVEMADGVLVRHVTAGPHRGLGKHDLPGQLCAFTAGVLDQVGRDADFDVVHSHYWLSGHVGWLTAEAWDVPLVHTMHTLAKVKNAALAPGDVPEPAGRVIGEEQVVDAAQALVASTAEEAADLVGLYDADPGAVHVVAPGVDLDLFAPGTERVDDEGLASAQQRARAALGLPRREQVVLFAGRVQPLKAPDVLVRALGELATAGLPVPLLVVLGGPSGNPRAVADLVALAEHLGVGHRVLVRPPVARRALVRWYRAADVVAVPSRSESFGLVAVEAQAAGTPVLAAAVGGLRTVVQDGTSGVLVRGHDPHRWAHALHDLLTDHARRRRLAQGAHRHTRTLGWDAAAEAMLKVYALAAQRDRPTGRGSRGAVRLDAAG